ncbi:hypothetical protein [Billgrantia montanilacus]|uniref:Peptidase C-terminal archaeal/bacterial domain-containing protein n=1 Tax=Billgrantia montanilacus TaxID=2282305 RepID=A0A368TP48_9GAMM|nr:hypothetical protein [Halomonas montanilacus]RCV86394.1 hypothetical protein DU505_20770 [Halomonas montanilacus]
MANRASSMTLTALGGVAVGLLIGWQLPALATSSESDTEIETTADDDSGMSTFELIQLGERHRGEITSQSELNGKDGSRFTRFTLPLEEGALIEIELGGPLHGTLSLYDDEEQMLTSTYEPTAYLDPGQTPALRHRIDESGDYTLIVSGNDLHSYGPFSLTSRSMELTTSDTLSVPSRADGWLQDGSDQYTLTVEESGLYQIEMRSSDVDAYLVLEGPHGYQREDDDSAGNLDARIADFLEPGEYQLTARTAYGQESGLYTLSVEPHELADGASLRNSGELTIDEPLQGWLNGEPLTYQLTLETPATVTIDMLSSDFDAFLELHGEGISTSDDDGGEELNARIRYNLGPGSYTVTARSHSFSGSGLFELKASAVELDELPADGQLSIGQPLNARLEVGARDAYTFQLDEAGTYRLDMMSSELDAYLELEGEGLFLNDDDSGDNLDARIETHLEPGEYRAIARSFNGSDSGSYVLSLSAE